MTKENKNNKHSYLTFDSYQELYNKSLSNPNKYWGKVGKNLHWFKDFTIVKNTSFKPDNIYIKWYEDGILNTCYNCIDVHLPQKAKDIALIWEGNEENKSKQITYQELHNQVCKLANGLKALGVKKGDVVTICMPMIPEAVYAMLAVARIGAIHSVVFSGFSAKAIAERITSCNSTYLITADTINRGGKIIALKDGIHHEIEKIPTLKKVVVCSSGKILNCNMSIQDISYEQLTTDQDQTCEAEPMNAEDALFILYTSGSTNKPKGIVHSTGGYSVYAKHTFETNFDYRTGEIFFTAGNIGWITGHSYIVYGPLLSGATTVLFEGVPTYPTPARIWQICEKHNVNILYTSPTLIRSLMKHNNEYVLKHNLKSLRILGSVGEPINVEAWQWYYKIVGKENVEVVDTWWQTETGGHMIAPIPYLESVEPTIASTPFFGIKPILFDENKKEITEASREGALCIADSWPGQARTIYNNHELFVSTYFSQYEGYYFSGDGALYYNNKNHLKITGRMDDIINVSGHRLSTAQLENIIDEHPDIAESAIIGITDSIKGQEICVFASLHLQHKLNPNLNAEIIELVQKNISKIATPKTIYIVPDLPRTRSGKIMRRILKKIAEHDFQNLGDISTLVNPEIVDEIKKAVNNV